MREINETDWKILRQLHTVALERFCAQILLEVERINSDRAKTSHQKYLDIWKVFKERDKELGQAFDDLKRSRAFIMIASMKGRGLLTEEEFSRFSGETREVIEVTLGTRL